MVRDINTKEQPVQSVWTPNEWYEALLLLRRDQPRRYARNISAATQRCVEIYVEQKERASKKAA